MDYHLSTSTSKRLTLKLTCERECDRSERPEMARQVQRSLAGGRAMSISKDQIATCRRV